MRRAYKNLSELLNVNLSRWPEEKEFGRLTVVVKPVLGGGWLKKKDFVDVCRWKSPRPGPKISSNSAVKINDVIQKTLRKPKDGDKICELTELDGVGVRMASALLTVIDPNKYGVLDWRTWQILCLYGQVRPGNCGTDFTPRQYAVYIQLVRRLAKIYGVKPRDIDRTLWNYQRQAKLSS